MESSYQLNFNFGFSTHKSDILLHLSQWQYWWWFWFSFFWTFYYFIILRTVKNRVTKMNPKINTSLRGRGKWGDFLVAVLPLSWCINILLNSNFILRMFEWQNESSLFTLRVHGKQWYWIYKFDLLDVTNILTTPKNVGTNRWVINTPQDLIVCDSYLQAVRLRTQSDWMLLYWKELLTKSFSTFKNVDLLADSVNFKKRTTSYLFLNKQTNNIFKNKLNNNFELKFKKTIVYSPTTLKLYNNISKLNIKKSIYELNNPYLINFKSIFSTTYIINLNSIISKNYLLSNLYKNLINFYIKKPDIFKNINNFFKSIKTKKIFNPLNNATFKKFNQLENINIKFQKIKNSDTQTTFYKNSYFFKFFLKNKPIYNFPKPMNLKLLYSNLFNTNNIITKFSSNLYKNFIKSFYFDYTPKINVKFFRYPNNILNKISGTNRGGNIKIILNSLLKKTPYDVINSKIKHLEFKNSTIKFFNFNTTKIINPFGYNFIKFKIKKLNFYNLHKTLDNLNLQLFDNLKRSNSHYNYDELDNTWNIKVNLIPQTNSQPLRLLKHILTNEYLNSNSDLLKFNYFDNNNEMGSKVPDNNDEHWVMKQKRLKKIKDIEISKNKDYEHIDFDVMRNIYKKQIINNLKLITDIEFLMNPYDLYKCVRNNRSRSENLPIHIYRRLLRTTTTLVLPAHVNITVVTNSYDVVHSWFLPGLGLKMDCVPGRSTHHSLYLDNIGFYYGQCAEICGRYHHHMPIRLCVLPFEHFLVWWQVKGLPEILRLNTEKQLKNRTPEQIEFLRLKESEQSWLKYVW